MNELELTNPKHVPSQGTSGNLVPLQAVPLYPLKPASTEAGKRYMRRIKMAVVAVITRGNMMRLSDEVEH